jgi:hypothetical protein
MPGAATVDLQSATALGIGETIRGMQSVLRESAGTLIMQGPDGFMLAWPKGGSYAFTFLSSSGADLNGINQNVFTFSDMLSQLETEGWKYVGPASVPAAISKVIMSYTIEAVLTGLNCLPSIFVVPAGIMDTMPVMQVEEIPT